MYFILSVFILLCILLACLQCCRRSQALRKIRCLSMEEKCRILSELIAPLGFFYSAGQDIFTSRPDAWQRHWGYCGFYDRTAPLFGMVFDCAPVFFDYGGQTWMIEFWKGQYGINTGCEAGVYHAATTLPSWQRAHAVFSPATEDEMLPICIALYRKGRMLFSLSKHHWWLTGFCMGLFSNPETLLMTISITFPNQEMACAFAEAAKNTPAISCRQNGCIATIHFGGRATTPPGRFLRAGRAAVQWKNRLLCRLYRQVTRHFRSSIDRLLYLYYFWPFAFRKMVSIRKPRKRWY